ncbi:unnamed protein product [Mytilus coruscus]|uniref:Uncharacterized protein n=1 Tax=Mytilus coruscus TaxID=42192 RepID=A0A6J8BEZ5_MYTCO|nr:unnamed protein product [Mytilus coruscus]
MLTNQVSHDMDMLLETPGIIGGDMSSSIEGPDKIPKQLMAFEKLLRHAISRFSKDSLYDMLLTLNSEMDTPRSRGGQRVNTGDPNRKIQSMRQVRQLIKSIEEAAIKGRASDHELRCLKSFETFDRDVRYLRDLKAYFDSNILKSLNEEYYDPADFPNATAVPQLKGLATPESSRSRKGLATPESSRSRKGLATPESSRSRKGLATPESSRSRKGLATPESSRSRKGLATPESSRSRNATSKASKEARDHARLPSVVVELKELSGVWGELLSDGNLDISIFDPDSHHELLQFENYHSFEPILRMVPDVFVKSYRAIDLGREWLAVAVRIYGERLPLRKVKPKTHSSPPPPPEVLKTPTARSRIPSAEVEKRVSEVKHHISIINKDITEKQEIIVSLAKDEKKLSKREKRSDALTNNFEKVDNKMQRAQRDFQRAVADLDRMNDQIKFLPNNSPKYTELFKRCKNIEIDIENKQNTLQMLEYEKSVVQEDYLLELEMRPHFIHYIGDIQHKIETLKTEVKEKQNAKKELEKQIVLIKTSKSASVNKSMQKYLNGELAYDLEAVTHRIEMAQSQDDERSIKSAASGTTYTDSDVDLAEYLVDEGRQQSESDLQFFYDADGEKAGITKPHMHKDIIGKPRIPESVLAPTQNRQKPRAKVS